MTAATWTTSMPASPAFVEEGKHYVDRAASDEDRQWALWTHLAPLLVATITSGMLTFLAIGWGLYVLYVPGKKRPFVADHAREMTNFGISYLIYWTVGSLVIGIVSFGAALVVWLPFLVVIGLVGTILATIAGAKGRYYRYPMCIRFLKAPAEPAQSESSRARETGQPTF